MLGVVDAAAIFQLTTGNNQGKRIQAAFFLNQINYSIVGFD